MEKHNTPLLYLHLQKRLKEICNVEEEVFVTEYLKCIHWIKIPHVLIPPILKEMEQYGLLKRDGKFKVKLENPKQCRILDTPNKINSKMKLF